MTPRRYYPINFVGTLYFVYFENFDYEGLLGALSKDKLQDCASDPPDDDCNLPVSASVANVKFSPDC